LLTLQLAVLRQVILIVYDVTSLLFRAQIGILEGLKKNI